MRKALITAFLVFAIFSLARLDGQMLQSVIHAPRPIVKLGDTNVEATDDNGTTPNLVIANPITTPAYPVTVRDCVMRIGSVFSGYHQACAIYSNNPSGGDHPGTLLCNSASTATTAANSWHTASLSGCGTLSASTKFWMAMNTDGASYIYNPTGNPGHAPSEGFAYPNWPGTFAVGSTYNLSWSFYIEVQ